MADVRIQNEGTIFLFDLLTDAAIEWWDESVQDSQLWCFWRVVENRYASDIIDGLAEAGFEIEGI